MQDKEYLHYVASQLTVKINIDDLVHELINEISSDEEIGDALLEWYLVSPSQGMAKTKQMGRKMNTLPNLFLSPGGLPLTIGGEPSTRSGASRMATRSSPRKQPILSLFSSDEDPKGSGGSSRSKCSWKDEDNPSNEGEPSKMLIPTKNIQKARAAPKPSKKERNSQVMEQDGKNWQAE